MMNVVQNYDSSNMSFFVSSNAADNDSYFLRLQEKLNLYLQCCPFLNITLEHGCIDDNVSLIVVCY